MTIRNLYAGLRGFFADLAHAAAADAPRLENTIRQSRG